ncbi:10049_t:CDS:2 [Paraglomus brasilianum]|uniref:10049_t:CDS:1 n=1 Tax=Paraglomus brasilianum TaxID=144538 RepID=A0A9N9A130_9GLOM|nr:10049_t:CDS:2 [Paraglomus brasilianum]
MSLATFSSGLLLDLSANFKKLYDSGEDHDVIFRVGVEESEFRAHSSILKARSAYFNAAFSNMWARKEDGVFVFTKDNISSVVFDRILKFVYSGSINLDTMETQTLLELLIAADELELQSLITYVQIHLISKCTNWLRRRINMVLVLHIVCEHEPFDQLREYVLEYICRDAKPFFESDEFTTLREDALALILARDDLELDEVRIWDNVIRWGITHAELPLSVSNIEYWSDAEFEALKTTLQHIIPLVRFFYLSPVEFETRVIRLFRKLIPYSMQTRVYEYYSNPNMLDTKSTVPLPRVSAFPFDSSIISAKDVAQIASWIDNRRKQPYNYARIPYEFKLILRASRDGYGVDTFHKLCDGYGPTVVVCKVKETGTIIGGFNSLCWHGYYKWGPRRFAYREERKETSENFLFTFGDTRTRAHTRVVKVKSQNVDEAIIWDGGKGPYFNSDLMMAYSPLVNGNHNWKCQQLAYEAPILDGPSSIFSVDEYEVFLVVEKSFMLVSWSVRLLRIIRWAKRYIAKWWDYVGLN